MRYSFLICKPKIDHDVTWVLRKYLVEGEHSLQKQELFLPSLLLLFYILDLERAEFYLSAKLNSGWQK